MTDPLKPEDRALIQTVPGGVAIDRSNITLRFDQLSWMLGAARQEGRCSPSGGGVDRDALARRVAEARQGQRSTPRCEPPGQADVDIARFWVDLTIDALPTRDEAAATGWESLPKFMAGSGDEAALPEAVAWAKFSFIRDREGREIGMDEPVVHWGPDEPPEERDPWKPLYAAPQPATEPPADVVQVVKALAIADDVLLGTARRLKEYGKPHAEIDASREITRAALEAFADRVPLDNEGAKR